MFWRKKKTRASREHQLVSEFISLVQRVPKRLQKLYTTYDDFIYFYTWGKHGDNPVLYELKFVLSGKICLNVYYWDMILIPDEVKPRMFAYMDADKSLYTQMDIYVYREYMLIEYAHIYSFEVNKEDYERLLNTLNDWSSDRLEYTLKRITRVNP